MEGTKLTTEMFITSIAINFQQPIAHHLSALLRSKPDGLDKDRIIPVVLLTVAMFESYMVRARYLSLAKTFSQQTNYRIHSDPAITDRLSGCDVAEKHFKELGSERLKALQEIYVLRDALTHNVLWEWQQDASGTRTVTRRLFGGDKKFKAVVPDKALPIAAHEIRTALLGLQVVPGEQTRETTKTACLLLLDVLLEVSQILDSKSPHGAPNQLAADAARMHVMVPTEIRTQYFNDSRGRSVPLRELFACL